MSCTLSLIMGIHAVPSVFVFNKHSCGGQCTIKLGWLISACNSEFARGTPFEKMFTVTHCTSLLETCKFLVVLMSK